MECGLGKRTLFLTKMFFEYKKGQNNIGFFTNFLNIYFVVFYFFLFDNFKAIIDIDYNRAYT